MKLIIDIPEDALKEMKTKEFISIESIDTAIECIKNGIPLDDVRENVHGEWITGGYDDMYYICSKCGYKATEYYHKPKFNFCPNCGADMRGAE